VDTPNSQKRSPRSSAKSKKDTTGSPEASRLQRKPFEDFDEEEKYMNRSIDQVARVRAAKEAAQREMESFGDVSEYDITIIQGQLKEEPASPSQPLLEFHGETSTDIGEKA
jgi:hypothetical protein